MIPDDRRPRILSRAGAGIIQEPAARRPERGIEMPRYSLKECSEAPMKAGVLQGVKVSQA